MSDFKRIDEMFAFVAEEQGGEGIISMHTGQGWMPLVGADMARIDSLRPFAKEIAERSGMTVKLLKFSVRTEVEIVK